MAALSSSFSPLPAQAPAPFVPRYYQKQQVQALFNARDLGKQRVVVSAPTGVGKTVTMALAARETLSYDQEGTVLVCIPFLSLLEQTVAQFQRFFSPQDIGVVQADTREYGRKIIIGSTQTLVRPGVAASLLRGWSGRKPLVLNFDECHERALTEQTRRFFDAMMDRDTQLVGWSATHNRADGRSLRPVFSDGIISYHPILEMVLNGFLVPVDGHDIPTDLDLGDFLVNGEIVEQESKTLPSPLQSQLEQSNRYERGYQSWRHYIGPGRRTLLFAHTIRDCYGWRDYFRAKGQDCEVIESRNNMETRKNVLGRLKSGELPLVINYDVLGTGLDIPEIEGIINARHGISKPKFIQHIGRGMRLCPRIQMPGCPVRKKDQCLFLNLTDTHHLLSVERDLLGLTTTSSDTYRRRLLSREESEGEQEGEDTSSCSSAEREERNSQPYEIQARIRRIEAAAINVFTGDGWVHNPETDLFVKDAGPLGRLLVEGDFLGGYSVRHLSPKNKVTWVEQSNEQPLSALEARAAGAAHLEYRRRERSKATDPKDPARALPLTDRHWEGLVKRQVPNMGKSAQEARDADMREGDYYDLYVLLKEHKSAFAANQATGWKCRGKVQTQPKKTVKVSKKR